jgi:hypothetical protein
MKSVRTTVVVAALVALATTTAASGSVPAWRVAKLVALPTGAQGIPDGFLPTLSCVSAGNCEAGGAYTNARGDVEGLVLTETAGVWTTPTTLAPPADAAGNPGVTLYDLSCGALGNCAAVGSYSDRAGNTEAFVANEVGGHWGAARAVTLPANAAAKGQSALLRSVDCPAAGTCSAVGTYGDNDALASRSEGFVVAETSNAWGPAREITIDERTNFNPFVTMNQIACSTSGDCTAVGSFIDANDVTDGLVLNEVDGAWRPAVALALPANASAFAGATISEVTCVRGSSCAVLGTYNTTTGAVEALVATNHAGAWSRARELTMPANAAANPHVFLYGFTGIACASAGACAVGGQYQDTSGDYQGFLVDEDHNAWTSGTELQLPSGGRQAGKNGGVVAVACPSAGNCRASGAYLDSSGDYQALVVNQADGLWQRGEKVILPDGGTTVGVDGGIYSLLCASVNSCVGTGSYLKGGDTYEGFTLSG